MRIKIVSLALSLVVACACQRSVKFGSVPIEVTQAVPVPSANPTPEPKPVPQALATPSPITTPLPVLKPVTLEMKRFENDAWFKTCFWITVNSKHDDSSFIGCNKGLKTLGTITKVSFESLIEKGLCPTFGIRAEVFRNSENCISASSCLDSAYKSQPDYVRLSNYSSGQGQAQPAHSSFIVMKRGERSAIDSRISLSPELSRAHSEWSDVSKLQDSITEFRVFFEDQEDAAFQKAFDAGQSLEKLGIDFNDVVFDISFSSGQPFGFDRTTQKCP